MAITKPIGKMTGALAPKNQVDELDAWAREMSNWLQKAYAWFQALHHHIGDVRLHNQTVPPPPPPPKYPPQ